METREQKRRQLMDWIGTFRRVKNITPQAGSLFELSCEAFGEGYNLLRQLVYTDENFAVSNCWGEIDPSRDKNGEILDMVLEETRSYRWRPTAAVSG